MEKEFKIGDKVVETTTGDIGVITEAHDWPNQWWVKWETGEFAGECLHISEEAIKKIEETNSNKEFDPNSYLVYRANKDYMTEGQQLELIKLLYDVEHEEGFRHKSIFVDSSCISEAFVFASTKQGYSFWQTAYYQIKDKKEASNTTQETETPEQDASSVKDENSAVAFLKKAAELQENRAKEYDQEGGERSAGKIAQAFNAITGHNLTENDVWMLLVVLKQVRFYNNPANRHRDSVEDLVSYAALFAESVFKQEDK